MTNSLSHEEVEQLRCLCTKALERLLASDLKLLKARKRVQTDPYDIYERRSAACPYEQRRAREYVFNHPAIAGEGWFHVTGGNSKLRVPLSQFREVDPERTCRKVRRAIAALRHKGIKVEALIVFEVVAVRYLDGREELEPHFHVVIRGATEDQLREAFAFRKDAAAKGRKRPLHVEPVYDLAKLLGYLTKFKGQVRKQYVKEVDGKLKLRWRANDLRGPELAAWTRFMSSYRVADLLKFHGIEGRDLRLAGVAELSMPRPTGPAGSRLRGSGRS